VKKKQNFFILLSINILFSQSIPNDFRINSTLNFLNDFGLGWNLNSLFKPVLFQDINTIDISIEKEHSWYLNKLFFNYDSSNNRIRRNKNSASKIFPGFFMQGSIYDSTKSRDELVFSIYNYLHYSFNKNVHSWLYLRITNSPKYLPRFTGFPRKKSRLGFNSGETDISGFGYLGNVFRLWIGRDRQNWGAMNFDNLAVSENSASYDQGVFDVNINNFKYRFFYGFLETINNGVNRYINGRGIEYNNYKNLLIGFHEIVIYSGLNRGFDFAYLNPIGTHLEIELNNRDNNFGGTGAQNAIWQFSIDYMPLNGLRLSSNFLIDELAIDSFEADTMTNKNDIAIQNRISYSRILSSCMTTFYFNYTYIGTYTLRHERGENNFVTRNKTLGTSLGSDLYYYNFGIRIITPWQIKLEAKLGEKKTGQNNILNNLYSPNFYLNGSSFPSGTQIKNRFLSLNLLYKLRDNFIFILDYKLEHFNKSNYNNRLTISINTQFNTSINI